MHPCDIPGVDEDGYRYPDDQFSYGFHNYVDLTIYHPKYGGRYDNHVPIDLAHYYCTISKVIGKKIELRNLTFLKQRGEMKLTVFGHGQFLEVEPSLGWEYAFLNIDILA